MRAARKRKTGRRPRSARRSVSIIAADRERPSSEDLQRDHQLVIAMGIALARHCVSERQGQVLPRESGEPEVDLGAEVADLALTVLLVEVRLDPSREDRRTGSARVETGRADPPEAEGREV